MRVLQVVPTSGAGGAEHVVLSLSQALANSGIEVAVASTAHDPYLFRKLDSMGITSIPLKSRDRRSLVTEIARLARRYRPHLLHSHMFDANFPTALAGAIARVPVVSTVHSTVYELETRRRRMLNALMGRLARRLAVVSRSVATALENAGIAHQKIACIYNGIDTSLFLDSRKTTLRDEIGVGNDSRLVGMVANLRPAKDHELLIRAAEKVIESMPDVRFVLVGDGVDSGARRLVSLVSEVGLEHRVHLLGFRDDVPDVLGSLDLFVLVSKVEGLPISVIEAMAAGLPVVASRVGGVHELVEDGASGFLVPPGDRDALADRIMDIMSDRESACRMGEVGRQRAIGSFSLESMAGGYRQLYRECLG